MVIHEFKHADRRVQLKPPEQMREIRPGTPFTSRLLSDELTVLKVSAPRMSEGAPSPVFRPRLFEAIMTEAIGTVAEMHSQNGIQLPALPRVHGIFIKTGKKPRLGTYMDSVGVSDISTASIEKMNLDDRGTLAFAGKFTEILGTVGRFNRMREAELLRISDYFPKHVIVGGERAGVIDFEKAAFHSLMPAHSDDEFRRQIVLENQDMFVMLMISLRFALQSRFGPAYADDYMKANGKDMQDAYYGQPAVKPLFGGDWKQLAFEVAAKFGIKVAEIGQSAGRTPHIVLADKGMDKLISEPGAGSA